MFVVRENKRIPGIHFIQFSGKPTDEELQVYLDSERERLSAGRGERNVTVLHLTEAWTAIQRKNMQELEKEVIARSWPMQLALAMVIPNRLVRGGITAYFWIAPAPYATKMVAAATDAYDFVASQLEEAGRAVPSRERYVAEAEAEWSGRVATPGVGWVPLGNKNAGTG